MSEAISLYAVGDVCVDRENPESIFALAQPKLKEADILFGQLETNISDRGLPAVQAGVPLRKSPKTISAYTYAGFNVLSFASNHTLDWNVDALMDTIEIVKKNGMEVIGCGKDIEEARVPVREAVLPPAQDVGAQPTDEWASLAWAVVAERAGY